MRPTVAVIMPAYELNVCFERVRVYYTGKKKIHLIVGLIFPQQRKLSNKCGGTLPPPYRPTPTTNNQFSQTVNYSRMTAIDIYSCHHA